MLHNSSFQLQVNGLIKLELHIEIYKYILVIQIDDAVSIHSEAIQKFFLHTVCSSPLFD